MKYFQYIWCTPQHLICPENHNLTRLVNVENILSESAINLYSLNCISWELRTYELPALFIYSWENRWLLCALSPVWRRGLRLWRLRSDETLPRVLRTAPRNTSCQQPGIWVIWHGHMNLQNCNLRLIMFCNDLINLIWYHDEWFFIQIEQVWIRIFYIIDVLTYLQMFSLSLDFFLEIGQNNFQINGTLLSKLFWSTVKKTCSTDQEKLLKSSAEGQECVKYFEITRTIYSSSERSQLF